MATAEVCSIRGDVPQSFAWPRTTSWDSEQTQWRLTAIARAWVQVRARQTAVFANPALQPPSRTTRTPLKIPNTSPAPPCGLSACRRRRDEDDNGGPDSLPDLPLTTDDRATCRPPSTRDVPTPDASACHRKSRAADDALLPDPSMSSPVDFSWDLGFVEAKGPKKKKAAPPAKPQDDANKSNGGDGGGGGTGPKGGGDAGGGNASGAGAAGDGNKDDSNSNGAGAWSTLPTAKKQNGKKGEDEADLGSGAKPNFDAFHEIKLDDTAPVLDINFGTVDKQPSADSGAFGAWGSSWTTGLSSWNFSGTAASSKPDPKPEVPAADNNPWGANRGKPKKNTFSFGEFGLGKSSLDGNQKDGSDEVDLPDYGFSTVSTKDKKGSLLGDLGSGAAATGDDDWQWSTASKPKAGGKESDTKTSKTEGDDFGWGGGWGSATAKKDKKKTDAPAAADDWGSNAWGKKDKPKANDVGNSKSKATDDWSWSSNKKESKEESFEWNTWDGPPKKKDSVIDKALEPAEDDGWMNWGQGKDKDANAKHATATDSLSWGSSAKKKAPDSSSKPSDDGWGGWGSLIKDKKSKGSDIDAPPAAPDPPKMDLTEPELDVDDTSLADLAAAVSQAELDLAGVDATLADPRTTKKEQKKLKTKKEDLEKVLQDARDALAAAEELQAQRAEAASNSAMAELDSAVEQAEKELSEVDGLLGDPFVTKKELKKLKTKKETCQQALTDAIAARAAAVAAAPEPEPEPEIIAIPEPEFDTAALDDAVTKAEADLAEVDSMLNDPFTPKKELRKLRTKKEGCERALEEAIAARDAAAAAPKALVEEIAEEPAVDTAAEKLNEAVSKAEAELGIIRDVMADPFVSKKDLKKFKTRMESCEKALADAIAARDAATVSAAVEEPEPEAVSEPEPELDVAAGPSIAELDSTVAEAEAELADIDASLADPFTSKKELKKLKTRREACEQTLKDARDARDAAVAAAPEPEPEPESEPEPAASELDDAVKKAEAELVEVENLLSDPFISKKDLKKFRTKRDACEQALKDAKAARDAAAVLEPEPEPEPEVEPEREPEPELAPATSELSDALQKAEAELAEVEAILADPFISKKDLKKYKTKRDACAQALKEAQEARDAAALVIEELPDEPPLPETNELDEAVSKAEAALAEVEAIISDPFTSKKDLKKHRAKRDECEAALKVARDARDAAAVIVDEVPDEPAPPETNELDEAVRNAEAALAEVEAIISDPFTSKKDLKKHRAKREECEAALKEAQAARDAAAAVEEIPEEPALPDTSEFDEAVSKAEAELAEVESLIADPFTTKKDLKKFKAKRELCEQALNNARDARDAAVAKAQPEEAEPDPEPEPELPAGPSLDELEQAVITAEVELAEVETLISDPFTSKKDLKKFKLKRETCEQALKEAKEARDAAAASIVVPEPEPEMVDAEPSSTELDDAVINLEIELAEVEVLLSDPFTSKKDLKKLRLRRDACQQELNDAKANRDAAAATADDPEPEPEPEPVALEPVISELDVAVTAAETELAQVEAQIADPFTSKKELKKLKVKRETCEQVLSEARDAKASAAASVVASALLLEPEPEPEPEFFDAEASNELGEAVSKAEAELADVDALLADPFISKKDQKKLKSKRDACEQALQDAKSARDAAAEAAEPQLESDYEQEPEADAGPASNELDDAVSAAERELTAVDAALADPLITKKELKKLKTKRDTCELALQDAIAARDAAAAAEKDIELEPEPEPEPEEEPQANGLDAAVAQAVKDLAEVEAAISDPFVSKKELKKLRTRKEACEQALQEAQDAVAAAATVAPPDSALADEDDIYDEFGDDDLEAAGRPDADLAELDTAVERAEKDLADVEAALKDPFTPKKEVKKLRTKKEICEQALQDAKEQRDAAIAAAPAPEPVPPPPPEPPVNEEVIRAEKELAEIEAALADPFTSKKELKKLRTRKEACEQALQQAKEDAAARSAEPIFELEDDPEPAQEDAELPVDDAIAQAEQELADVEAAISDPFVSKKELKKLRAKKEACEQALQEARDSVAAKATPHDEDAEPELEPEPEPEPQNDDAIAQAENELAEVNAALADPWISKKELKRLRTKKESCEQALQAARDAAAQAAEAASAISKTKSKSKSGGTNPSRKSEDSLDLIDLNEDEINELLADEPIAPVAAAPSAVNSAFSFWGAKKASKEHTSSEVKSVTKKPATSRLTDRLRAFEPSKEPEIDIVPEPVFEVPPPPPPPPPEPPIEVVKDKKKSKSKSKSKKEEPPREQEIVPEPEPEPIVIVAKDEDDSPKKKLKDLPGSFPDDEIMEIIDMSAERKSRKSKKAEKVIAPEPVPEPEPEPSDSDSDSEPEPMSVDAVPPPAPDAPPTPPSEPRTSKKDRPRVVRDGSSWGNWSTPLQTSRKEEKKLSKDEVKKPKSTEMNRSKSTSRRDEKSSSKDSTSEKADTSTKAKRRASVFASTPPVSRSKPTAEKRSSKSSSRRRSVDIADTGLISPPPEMADKAAKMLGITPGKLSRSQSEQRKSRSLEEDDIVMVDADGAESPSLKRSNSSAKKAAGLGGMLGRLSSSKPSKRRSVDDEERALRREQRRSRRETEAAETAGAATEDDQEARRARRAARRAEREATERAAEEARRAKDDARRERRRKQEEEAEARRNEDREARRAARRERRAAEEAERAAVEAKEAERAERRRQRRAQRDPEDDQERRRRREERRSRRSSRHKSSRDDDYQATGPVYQHSDAPPPPLDNDAVPATDAEEDRRRRKSRRSSRYDGLTPDEIEEKRRRRDARRGERGERGEREPIRSSEGSQDYETKRSGNRTGRRRERERDSERDQTYVAEAPRSSWWKKLVPN